MVQVFTYSFEFFTSPTAVQHYCRLLVAKWGVDLDATAPTCVRTGVWRAMKRWGVPGTPLA